MRRFLGSLAATVLALIAPGLAQAGATTESYGGRSLIVYAPAKLPPAGERALVIVLHGGLGNAQHIEAGRAESGLNMDAVAEKDGFVVAYLNGTPVTRRLGGAFLGWNAGGGCCGMSAENNVDDVAYITGAVRFLEQKYGVDPKRVFSMGHSNGAMMTQRLVCESDLLAAGIAISGPLNLPVERCAHGQGKRILALHGEEDVNVPPAGGNGRGLAGVAFVSEARSREVMTRSGVTYDLQMVPGADHFLNHIDDAIHKAEGQSIAEKAARYFGLAGPG